MTKFLDKRGLYYFLRFYWLPIFVIIMGLCCGAYFYLINTFLNPAIRTGRNMGQLFSPFSAGTSNISSSPNLSIEVKKGENNKCLLSFGEVGQYLQFLKRSRKYRDPFFSEAELRLRNTLLRISLPKIEGVMKIGKTWIAIIDGKSVKVGETIKGYQVKQITQGAVILQRGKQIYYLYLK